VLIGRIEGATRVLGKSQGYLGLPIKDELVNESVNGVSPSMVTAWIPTPREIEAIIAGSPVYVRIMGTQHPPMMVETGELLPPATEDRTS
jgi:hypothetical protein